MIKIIKVISIVFKEITEDHCFGLDPTLHETKEKLQTKLCPLMS